MKNIFEQICMSMSQHNDSVDNIVGTTHSVEELREIKEHEGFTIWTKDRVYFPSTSENIYNIESVPRNPSKEACGVFY